MLLWRSWKQFIELRSSSLRVVFLLTFDVRNVLHCERWVDMLGSLESFVGFEGLFERMFPALWDVEGPQGDGDDVGIHSSVRFLEHLFRLRSVMQMLLDALVITVKLCLDIVAVVLIAFILLRNARPSTTTRENTQRKCLLVKNGDIY